MKKLEVKKKVRIYETRILDRLWLTKNTFEVKFARPLGFTFTPGQRIRLRHGDMERDYSLISAPDDSQINVCVRLVAGGKISPFLATAESGTKMLISGPHGYFIFQSSTAQAVFVATGTGIAPFVAMARSGITGFYLLHGVGKRVELYFEALFKESTRKYIPCLSREATKPSGLAHYYNGRVSAYLEDRFPAGVYDFYLCGRREMIRDVTLLVDKLFPGSRIYTELFY
jgi:ferredoxin-NADP reductase